MSGTPKKWIKVWLSVLGNERFCALEDAEKWGYVHTLMVADSVDYTFANEGQLRMLTGASYRYVKKLRHVQLIKGLTVYQGKERQDPDPTRKVRMERFKEAHPERFAPVRNADQPAVNNGVANAPPLNPDTQSRELTPVSNETSPALAKPSRVQRVFEAWKQVTGRNGATKLNVARRRVITQALKDYPPEDVWDALRGWVNDPWPDRVNHTDVTVLLRDAQHVEKFRDLWRNGPPGGGVLPKNVLEQRNYMAGIDAAIEREKLADDGDLEASA